MLHTLVHTFSSFGECYMGMSGVNGSLEVIPQHLRGVEVLLHHLTSTKPPADTLIVPLDLHFVFRRLKDCKFKIGKRLLCQSQVELVVL